MLGVLIVLIVLGLTYAAVGAGHILEWMGGHLANAWRNVQCDERERKARIAEFAATHPEWRPRRRDWYETH